MDRAIGTSQTSLANTSTGSISQVDYYIGRWVSDPLNQTSVAANTWKFNFAAQQSGNAARFPNNQNLPVYVNCYVWKPSNGTKYGTILDGNTGNMGSGATTAENSREVTFTGAAVSSLTANDACIVFEAWARVTQTDTNTYTQTFYFDGRIRGPALVDITAVTDHATFIETPENIAFTESTTYAETKLYLHDTTSGLPSGTLPTAEQSAKTVTASCNFEGSQTTNRLLDINIGVSQASLALATPANTSSNFFYVSRWVSPVIQDTSVPAATWTLNFAAKESNTSANFPVTSNNKAVAMCAYVWKPSNGTKYGNIFDGNTAGATVSEGAANTEKSQEVDFIGAAVNSLTAGDAIIVFEAWFNVTQGAATSYTDTYYYDGTTETAGGSTVSNHASFINLLNTALSFGAAPTNYDRPITESSISVGSGTVARVYGANRSITGGSVTIGSGSVSRIKNAVRAISESSITVGSGTVSRIKNAIRTISESSISVGTGTITRSQILARTISAGSVTVGSGTCSRIYGAIRAISQTGITVGTGTVSRSLSAIRQITDPSISVGSGTVSRVLVLVRNIPSSVSVAAGTLTRVVSNTRSIIEGDISVGAGTVDATIVILREITEGIISVGSGTLTRAVQNTRLITESTINVSAGTLSRVYHAFRSIPDTVSVGIGVLSRSVSYSRTINESSISVGSGSLSRVYHAFRTIPGSISVGSGVLSRAIQYHRTISESTISINDNLVAGIITLRNITESSISVGAGVLTRAIVNNRTIIQSVSVGTGICNRVVSLTRTCIGTITVGAGTVSRSVGFSRIISELGTSVGAGTVTKIYHAVRNMLEPTIIVSDAVIRSVSNSRVINQSISVGSGILTRVIGFGRQITEATISVFDSVSNVYFALTVTDYVPKLLHDFTEDIGKMVMDWLKSKYNIGDPSKT